MPESILTVIGASPLCRELCNECHTDDNYESSRGLMPGNLTYNFQARSTTPSVWPCSPLTVALACGRESAMLFRGRSLFDGTRQDTCKCLERIGVQVMNARFLKETLKVQQMVSNSNEGYRAQGIYDPYASVTYPFNVRRVLHSLALRHASMMLVLDCVLIKHLHARSAVHVQR